MRTSHSIPLATLTFAASLLLACGGSTADLPGGSGGGSVSGSVGGTALQAKSVLGVLDVANSTESCSGSTDGGETCVSSSSGQVVAVLLTSRADATCSAIQNEVAAHGNVSFANLDVLELLVGNDNGNVVAGTYTITAPQAGATSGVGARFSKSDASCASVTDLTATSGTITLSSVSPGSIAGSYDVTFGSQGTFTGSFDVAQCDIPDAGGSSPGSTTCQP